MRVYILTFTTRDSLCRVSDVLCRFP